MNGVLVLGEAEHLGTKNLKYRNRLLSANRLTRVTRLCLAKGRIAPWDDWTLPFAVEATLGLVASECAVSNAVLWSHLKANDDNANPSAELVERARRFWTEILPALAPTQVIACGKIAHSVFEPMIPSAGQSWRFMFPRLPSPLSTATLVRKFLEDFVATRSPAIAKKAKERPELLEKYRANKIAYHMATIKSEQA